MNARLTDLLARSAQRRPEAVAVEDPERDVAITYGNLAHHAAAITDALKRNGVGPGDRVGIYAPKSIGSVASIFGVLGAGATYVPVDPTAPPVRNVHILEDCTVRAAIVEASLVAGLRSVSNGTPMPVLERLDGVGEYGLDLFVLDGFAGNNAAQAVPDCLAYILYTSGSTGRPKGVMHTHDSALSFVNWCSEVFEPHEDDRFSSHAPFHFDLSILDLYVPIKHGATIVLIGEDLGKQPVRLAPMIADRRISMWYSTPSILRLLVEFGRMEAHDFSSLRIVNFAGEVFPIQQLRAVMSAWPRPRYFNLYGPTETNVCTFCEVTDVIPEDRTEPLPIGRTCANDRTRVMDEHDREVLRGETGELFVTGGSVMMGYWNRPELTEAAFHCDDEGVLWYRTGDVVKEAADGSYAFLGRRDRMVKRRGYRVELGEIEAALYGLEGVREAAVISVPDAVSGVTIKAFLSLSSDAKPSLIRMKRACTGVLPLYMVPDVFSFHPSLPKTSTDKIDYQSLKELD